MLNPEVRRETPGDEKAIFHVHERAFGQADEARLVDALRGNGNLYLSLVALIEGEIIGHIAFVPLVIENETAAVDALGLAPVGVLPEFQRRGVGSALIREGLEECARQGYPLVIVLGEPDYYSRFGFVGTKPYDIHSPFDVPHEFFMLRYAGESFPTEVRGTVRYTSEFDIVT